MLDMSYQDVDENENKFVSYFSDRFNIEGGIVYINKVIKEDRFINRLVIQSYENIENTLKKGEEIFRNAGIDPCIHIIDPNLREVIEDYGYKLYNKLSILLLESPYFIKGVKGIEIALTELDEWVNLYCKINGFEAYKDEIKERLNKAKHISIYVAKVKGLSVGCMALLDYNKVTGVYCMSVLEEFKRLGIISSLIRYAYELAKSKENILIIHTYVNDNLIKYYIKRGFVQLYIKDIYCKSLID